MADRDLSRPIAQIRMTSSRDAEDAFIHAFLLRERWERWLSGLASARHRGKLLNRLAHRFIEDLDPRYVQDPENLPESVGIVRDRLAYLWEAQNSPRLCYAIACNETADGQTLRFSETETDPRLTFGAVLLLIPDRLAYYYPERSNLSRQPIRLLIRP